MVINPWKKIRVLDEELTHQKGLIEELTKWRFDQIQIMAGGSSKEYSPIPEKELIEQNYGTVAFCTGLISDIVGMTKWFSLETTNSKTGTKEKVFDSDVIEFLKNPGRNYYPECRMNVRDFDGFDLHKKGQLHLDLTGNGYLYPVKNALGKYFQIWPLNPANVSVAVDPETGYLLNYVFRTGAGDFEIFDPWELIHLRYIHPKWEYLGASIIEQQSSEIDTGRAQNLFKLMFYEHDATPSMVIISKTPIGPDDKKDLRDKFEERHMGVRNSRRVALLQGRDVEIHQLSISPSDAQLLADQSFSDQRILRAFGIPEALFSQDANYANSTNAWKNFYRLSINPRRNLWLRSYMRGLVPRFDDAIELGYEDDSPEDKEFALQKAKMYLEMGVISPDQQRDSEGWEPHPDGRDEILIPERKGPPQEILDITPREEKEKKLRQTRLSSRVAGWRKNYVESYLKAHSSREASILKAVQRAFEWDLETILKTIDEGALDESIKTFENLPSKKRSGSDLRDACKKTGSLDQVFPVKDVWIKKWMEIVFDDFFGVYGYFGIEGAEEVSGVIGMEINFDLSLPWIKDQAKAILQTDLQTIINTSKDSLRVTISDVIAEGGTKDEVKNAVKDAVVAKYEKWTQNRESRSWRIARTETTSASNSAKIDSWVLAQTQTGIALEKEWIDTGDDDTRDSHIEAGGQRVPLNAQFSVGSGYGQYPGDPALPVEERVNCRCTHSVHMAGG